MSIIRSAKSASLSIVRHRGASAIAIATLAFMLSALTVFILIADGMNRAASSLESKANLIADLNPHVTPAQAKVLGHKIQVEFPSAAVQYVSKEDAVTQFRKIFADSPTMLGAMQGNPLPASLQVRTKDPRLLSKIAASLRHDRSFGRLIFNPDLTRKLIEITSVIRIGGIALVLGLAFLALIIVINTTHLTIDARHEEFEVMKLVGATHAFVRNPLIIEGVLLGVTGAGVAVLARIGVLSAGR